MIIIAQAGQKVRRRLDVFVIAIPIQLELYNCFFSMDLIMQCDLKIYCASFLFLRNPELSPPILSLTSQVVQGSIPWMRLPNKFHADQSFCSCDSHHIIVHHQASQVLLINFLLEFSYQLDHCRCTWPTQTSNHQEKNKLMPWRFVMMLA